MRIFDLRPIGAFFLASILFVGSVSAGDLVLWQVDLFDDGSSSESYIDKDDDTIVIIYFDKNGNVTGVTFAMPGPDDDGSSKSYAGQDAQEIVEELFKESDAETEARHTTPFDQWKKKNDVGIEPLHNPVVAGEEVGDGGSTGGGLDPMLDISTQLKRQSKRGGDPDDHGSTPRPDEIGYWPDQVGPPELVNPVLRTTGSLVAGRGLIVSAVKAFSFSW